MKRLIHSVDANRKNAFVIHYSCANFKKNSFPQIISIATRKLDNGEVKDFSIEYYAEKGRIDLSKEYESAETLMLKDFMKFLKKHKHCTFVHWNMRGGNYGFETIFKRLAFLTKQEAQNIEIDKLDLASALINIYGDSYIEDGEKGKLLELAELNQLSTLDTLRGEEEAEAFIKGEYNKIKQSTLRKVDCITDIFDKTAKEELKTRIKKHSLLKIGTWISIGKKVSGIVGFLATLFGLMDIWKKWNE